MTQSNFGNKKGNSTFGNICVWRVNLEVPFHTYSEETHLLSITFLGRTLYIQKANRKFYCEIEEWISNDLLFISLWNFTSGRKKFLEIFPSNSISLYAFLLYNDLFTI